MGKCILIGDRRQSIYRFRGAIDAITRFMELTACVSLPMNISQRCAIAIVNEANKVFGNDPISARDGAPKGSISELPANDMLNKVSSGDFILCRTNLPLVKAVYALIRMKKKAFILGRDIGFGLIKLLQDTAKDNKTQDLSIIATALTENCAATCAILEAAKKGMEAMSLSDRTESLLVFLEGSKTIAEVESKIKETFVESGEGICLSTVHKIKGAESTNVYILRPDLMPHPKSTNDMEESCIKFVAITRAKLNLTYVQGEINRDDKPDADTSDVLTQDTPQEKV